MVYLTKVGFNRYKFDVVAWNGQTVAESTQAYSKRKALKVIKNLQLVCKSTRLRAHVGATGFSETHASWEPHYGFIFSVEGQPVLKSQWYKTEASRSKGMESVVKNIDGPIYVKVGE